MKDFFACDEHQGPDERSSDDALFPLHVLDMSGQPLATVNASPTDLVVDLKGRLGFRRCGHLQTLLLFEGTPLDDGQPITECGLVEGASVTLVISFDWDTTPKTRAEAVKELSDLGVLAARTAVAALANDLPIDVQVWAVGHLKRLGREGEPHAAALVQALTSSPAHWLRFEAAEALEQMSMAAAAHVGVLASALLTESNRSVRVCIARVLNQLGEAALPAADILARVLCEDTEVRVREIAAKAIGELGPEALPVVHVALLWASMKDEESAVRCYATTSLGVLASAAAEREKPDTVVEFAESLAEVSESIVAIGPDAPGQAASTLLTAAAGYADDDSVRVAVAAALKALEVQKS